jgi:hypothetical protein
VPDAVTADANLTSRPSSRPLIAPAWHTIVFIAIFVGLSVIGGFFQHAAKQHPQAHVRSGSAVPGYMSVVVMEWLLVLYVRMGVNKCGARTSSPRNSSKHSVDTCCVSAGFCEELAFRGHLQQQFQSITGSAGWAVLIQAVVFGIGHLYEGMGAVARIMRFGVLFGLLALWRKSLVPGMIVHAGSDIFGVIIFLGMR